MWKKFVGWLKNKWSKLPEEDKEKIKDAIKDTAKEIIENKK